MGQPDRLLDDLLRRVPQELHDQPGLLLYSGRQAWVGLSDLYLMGLNPGGDPATERETVRAHTEKVLQTKPADFSEYRDSQWTSPRGGLRPVGDAPVQRRVRHLLDLLSLDPGTVPATNLVFARSRRWADLSPSRQRAMADACWPFHQATIRRLEVRVIVCFGQDAAKLVCERTRAHVEVDRFVEDNERRWTSRTFRGDGTTVVQLTHPAIADWCNPATDPSPLVVRALQRT